MVSATRFVWSILSLPSIVVGLINPIIPGFNPDPSIIRVGDDYFLATCTFEFFPGIPIYHSKDLVKWEHIGHALSRPSQLPLRGTASSGGISAPTLRYHQGTFYMTTTIHTVTSPPDEFTEETRPLEPVYVDQGGFDPDLFFDEDNRVYLTTTAGDPQTPHFGIFANWLSEIDIETGDALSNRRLLHETTSRAPSLYAANLTEGSHIYNVNGTYHMITADSGTYISHKTNSYRAASLDGPWEGNPNNPVLWNGKDTSQPVLSTGHADLVEAPDGSWWAVFLATRPKNPDSKFGPAQLGRETFLCPVTWEDGWPVFNNNKIITEAMPGVLYDLEQPRVWRDDFDGRLADKQYYYLRTPCKDFKDFQSSPGKLGVKGNIFTLSDRDTPAALLRKQVHHNTTFSTEITMFKPENNRQEAGVTVYLSTYYHNEVAITKYKGKRCIVLHTRTGPDAVLNTTYIQDRDIAASRPVKLVIEARENGYRFGYSTRRRDPRWVGFVDNINLQTAPVGFQNFVGAHFGIYSTGSGLPVLSPAEFEYIEARVP